MNFSALDIDRIVAQVMEELRPEPAPGPSAAKIHLPPASPVGSAPKVAPTPQKPAARPEAVVFTEAVITGSLLEGRVGESRSVRFAPHAVLTPTARDFLRIKQIEWSREAGNAVTASSAQWQAIVSKSFPPVLSAIEALKTAGEGWELRLSGTSMEAARQAVSAIARAEATGIAVFAEDPDVVACLANRNSRVRAAVVHNTEALASLRRILGPNVLAISPANKSFFELRNLLKTWSSGGTPVTPSGLE